MASKSIIADLNKSEKLNGDNYDIRKILYVLDEQNVLEGINHVINQPEEGNTAKHRRDFIAYKALKRKDSIFGGIIVISVAVEMISECEEFPNVHTMWTHL